MQLELQGPQVIEVIKMARRQDEGVGVFYWRVLCNQSFVAL